MVTVGVMLNEKLEFPIADEFLQQIITSNTWIKKPRIQQIEIQQLSTGSLVPVEEITGSAASLIGKTELTLVMAVSVDDAAYYGGETVTITYKSNDGVTHSALATIDPVKTDNEEPFYKFGLGSDGISYGAVAVTDFYQLLTMVTSKVTQGGETIGCGSTGALTQGVIAAANTIASAANIHGIGDVYVRGIDDTASMQAKDFKLTYFTPWGEQKDAIATTAADATTEIRFINAAGVYVGDFYRPITFWAETVPAATKNVLLTDAACSNVNGAGGDVYGFIEEGIKEMLSSYFFAAPNRITIIHGIHVEVATTNANAIIIQINYTPFGHDHQVAIQHVYGGGAGHVDVLNLRVEPDTDFYLSLIDVGDAKTPFIGAEYIYGQLTDAASQQILGGTT